MTNGLFGLREHCQTLIAILRDQIPSTFNTIARLLGMQASRGAIQVGTLLAVFNGRLIQATSDHPRELAKRYGPAIFAIVMVCNLYNAKFVARSMHA